MLYHATNDPNSNESSTRIARADRITWAEDHAPVFPRPTNQRRPSPSGQIRFPSDNSVASIRRIAPFVVLVSCLVLALHLKIVSL